MLIKDLNDDIYVNLIRKYHPNKRLMFANPLNWP